MKTPRSASSEAEHPPAGTHRGADPAGADADYACVAGSVAGTVPFPWALIANYMLKATLLHPTGKKIGHVRAAIRHVKKVDTSHHLEQFAVNMKTATVARGRHGDLAGITLGISNELRDSVGRQ